MTPGSMEQVRNLYLDSGLILLGSPVTTATGLLRVFIIDSAVSSNDFVPLTLVYNSSSFPVPFLCLREFLLLFQHCEYMAFNICMSF